MKAIWILALAAIISVGLGAGELAGTWKGSMQTQAGQADVTLRIEPGAQLKGTVEAGEYEGAIENAMVDGNKISFETAIAAGKLVFSGTVDGEEVKFDVTGTQGDKYALVCKRQK
jgi:hypothetical protein